MKNSSVKKNQIVETAAQHWKYVAPLIVFPKNVTEYNLLVKRLDQLLDMIGDDEKHPLMNLVDLLSHLISYYDETHTKSFRAQGVDALKYLMDLNELKQSDLHKIGSQGVVSEILNGKRKLNIRQIGILSKMFKVSPATFMDG